MNAEGFGSRTVTQVAIVVKDIERASTAWAEALGVPVPAWKLTDPEEKARTKYRGRPTAARAKLAFVPLGPVVLELIEPVGGPSTWKEHLDRHGESVHHIAFQVPDLPAAVKRLNRTAGQTLQTGDFTGGCYAYVDAIARLGVTLELLARREGRKGRVPPARRHRPVGPRGRRTPAGTAP
jgi:catechol 2,3-dioxygenase-like lactoylglutathione lyase family enzyme